jgi:hypothetical protein
LCYRYARHKPRQLTARRLSKCYVDALARAKGISNIFKDKEMQPIHYFQRYSQPENVATNNTLLLFSRLYHHSPSKFNLLLAEMFSESGIKPGIQFKQQERGSDSVPDGLISQESFQIVIETKLYDNFSIHQLLNHCMKFEDSRTEILLSLSPGKIETTKIVEKVRQFNIENSKQIQYRHITFNDIIKNFQLIISDNDIEFANIIDDYEEYCYSNGLIDLSDNKMRAVNCGQTLIENMKYDLYYDPIERGYSKHGYMGIYANKCIHAIGKITNIISADLKDGVLEIRESSAKVTDEQKERIIGAIEDAYENREWKIESGHKFFMVDKFHKTLFRKTSYLPMRGTQFFDLAEILEVDKLPEVEIIAERLMDKEW